MSRVDRTIPVTSQKLSESESISIRLDKLYESIRQERNNFLGYPCNQDFDYRPLYRFLDFSMNNVGDPFLESLFKLNTHEIECEVIEQFSKLCHAPVDATWGYITNGGTEGNMYGFYLARELHPKGLVYYSEDTHYSVSKILRLIKARSIMIKSQDNGEIDYDDLRETVRIHRDAVPIVVANVGTTMKGAIDQVDRIRGIIHDLAVPEMYLHVDAALSGMILPFINNPPPFGFNAGIDSIAISGHKMIGCPFPCGVVLAKRENVERISRSVEYIGSLDTTLSGSRNALAPLFLWYALKQKGESGFRAVIRSCLDNADYVIRSLCALGLNAWRNENSITVVFPRPSDTVVKKWQLAIHRDIAHIIAMPHVGKLQIDRFLADLRQDLIANPASDESL